LALTQRGFLGVREVHEVKDDCRRILPRSGEVDGLVGALEWGGASEVRSPPEDSPQGSPEIEFILRDRGTDWIIAIETKLNLLEVFLAILRDGKDSAVEELDWGPLSEGPIPLHLDGEKDAGFVPRRRVRDLPHGNRRRGVRRIIKEERQDLRLWGWVEVRETVIIKLDGQSIGQTRRDEDNEKDDADPSQLSHASALLPSRLKDSPATNFAHGDDFGPNYGPLLDSTILWRLSEIKGDQSCHPGSNGGQSAFISMPFSSSRAKSGMESFRIIMKA
jgi:hypothetical protein